MAKLPGKHNLNGTKVGGIELLDGSKASSNDLFNMALAFAHMKYDLDEQ